MDLKPYLKPLEGMVNTVYKNGWLMYVLGALILIFVGIMVFT